MIVVKIWGGLGNQLFQYAFGYAMAKEYDDELWLDTSFYSKHQYRYVGKRSFNLNKLITDLKIAEGLPCGVKIIESFLINRVVQRHKAEITVKICKVHFVKERKKTYMDAIPYHKGIINYYDGYWQSGLYFDKYAEELIEQIANPQFEIPEIVSSLLNTINQYGENSVSVHIRKGDFNGSIGHAIDNGYYAKAITEIRRRIKTPHFFVFSDDIKWVKENIDFGKDASFADYKVPYAAICDLYCMSRCSNGIMSASTFSWWGNWNKRGIIIAPSGFYFNDKFLNKDWITI